ncbi:MAG: succinate dehydrogenase/fumarate reductase iron-sulfur subunit [Ignavibacteriales bacterium]|nr:succinate dehydrogenase/fumarate reductase iron-sulfur subunit [Ignavibacteriales bacterium]
MNFTLRVWRQKNAEDKGRFENYRVEDVPEDASFLEMMDILNETLIESDREPIVFDHDCREGICGACSLFVSGRAHGPKRAVTACQLFMRSFKDGETIIIEPWRAKAFPVLKDLMVDRSAFDRIIQKGGYVSINTGGAPDAHTIAIPKPDADEAMDAAACIGCGACVATCPNASAMLFVAAKVSQLALLPQGKPERKKRVLEMIQQMDEEGFGACSNNYACEAECPKEISVAHIARLNREYFGAAID